MSNDRHINFNISNIPVRYHILSHMNDFKELELFPIGFLFHFRFSCRPHFITVHVSVATYQPAIWFFIKNIGKFSKESWLHRRMQRPLAANSGTREIWLETAGRGFTHRLTHCYTVLYRIPVLIRLQLFRWLFYWLNHRKTLSPIAIKFAFNCIRDTRRLIYLAFGA